MDNNFESKIKLGEIHEKNGDNDSSLKCYRSAYDIAVLLENKKYQVDALVKIVEGYYFKGEIEKSTKYAQVAEEILKNIDYDKGKLDISLYFIKVYYIKKEYYKAREIGNEALKLCTEEHIIYKGRILNSLAYLYCEITSIDEHLDLLKQSLECFEEANFLRGILGVLNNIGVAYAEKLQNNEKALEYFFKLKERSEDSNYLEFNVFAYFNIGEVYFKCLRFDEALSLIESALDKAKGANFEAMVFHSYAILISINLSLNNYKQAYYYFNLANEELETYPEQGVGLPWFYKAVASLFFKFGEIHKAKYNINKAMDTLDNGESIIKWNTGIVYEFIRLEESKNKMEILGALEGIRYILSKYKNHEVILDIVSDVVLELMELNYQELAFKLVDEYRNIKVENGFTRLKLLYIKALRCDNEEKEKMLQSALKLEAEIQNNKLHIKICSSLGEYYFNQDNYDKALKYYVDACRQMKNVILNVPKEYRIQFINSNNLYQQFNMIIQMKKHYSRVNINDIKQYGCINSEDELIEFLKGLDEF